MENAYFDALEECAGSADVRVIVVTGAGRGFCAGADMQDLQDARRRRRSDATSSRARAPAADAAR